MSARDERMQRQSGEKPRIARAGPDQPDAARLKLRQTEKRAVDHSETASRRSRLIPTSHRCDEGGAGPAAGQKVVICTGFAKIG